MQSRAWRADTRMSSCAKSSRSMQATIEAVPCDTVVIATPMNLERVIEISKPTVIVSSPCMARSWVEHVHGPCTVP